MRGIGRYLGYVRRAPTYIESGIDYIGRVYPEVGRSIAGGIITLPIALLYICSHPEIPRGVIIPATALALGLSTGLGSIIIDVASYSFHNIGTLFDSLSRSEGREAAKIYIRIMTQTLAQRIKQDLTTPYTLYGMVSNAFGGLLMGTILWFSERYGGLISSSLENSVYIPIISVNLPLYFISLCVAATVIGCFLDNLTIKILKKLGEILENFADWAERHTLQYYVKHLRQQHLGPVSSGFPQIDISSSPEAKQLSPEAQQLLKLLIRGGLSSRQAAQQYPNAYREILDLMSK